MKAHNLDIVGYLKLNYTPTELDHAVRLRDLQTVNSSGQPVFVTDVEPVSTGIVGSKQYADTIPTNVVLTHCISDTNDVRIHFLADGGSDYNPDITIDGQSVDVIEEVPDDKRLFHGYADINLTETKDVLVTSSTGSSFVITIEIDAVGPALSNVSIDTIPLGQTSVKEDDTVSFSGVVANDAVNVNVLDVGAAKSGSATVGAVDSGGVGFRTFSGTFIVSDRTGTQSITIEAVNQLGTSGSTLVSTDTVTLDQTYPVITVNSLTYNNGMPGLKLNDTATINLSIVGHDTQSFTFAHGDEGGSTSAYLTSRVLTVTSEVNSVTGGITITATRTSNGATTEHVEDIVVTSTVPNGYLEIPNVATVIEAGGPAGDIPEYPRSGVSPTNIDEDVEVDVLTPTNSTENQSITINATGSEYGFFVYPKDLGTAIFVDQATTLPGGWDGASWPDDGSFGVTYGPIEITRNGVQYYVYRTDFQGINTTFDVTFTNPGLTVGGAGGDKTVHILQSSVDGKEYDVHFVLNQHQYEVQDNGSNQPYPYTGALPVGSWKPLSLGIEVDDFITKGTLVISDADASGNTNTQLTVDTAVMQNLAGVNAVVEPFYYKIQGFELRLVSFAPFSQIAPIGAVVTDPTKVVAKYIGVDTPLNYRTDKNDVASSFTITDADGNVVAENGTHIWLNHVLYTQSNTSGELSVSVEEVL